MFRQDSTLTDTLEIMEQVFSHKYGLCANETTTNFISNIFSTSDASFMIGGSIPMYSSHIVHANSAFPIAGFAFSINKDKSRVRAFGEFIERFSAIYFKNERPDNTLFDCYDSMNAKGLLCLNPMDVIDYEKHYYNDPLFPCACFESSKPNTWIRGEEITTGKEVWLPMQKVLLNYPWPPDEKFIIYGLSTGLACGSSYRHAALSGLYEVIERDSFMLTWLLRIPGTLVEIDTTENKELAYLYEHIFTHLMGEDRLYIYDISRTKGVYTIMTYIRNNLLGAYGLIVSAASNTNPEKAIIKALEELCQCQYHGYHQLITDMKKECQNMELEDIDSLNKHFFYYSTGKHSGNIDFLSFPMRHIRLSDMVDYSTSSIEGDFDYIVDLFRQTSKPVYITDITKPEIKEIGLTVVKAVVPGYLDLNGLRHRFRQQKGDRLLEFKKGHDIEINADPHPFS